MYISLFILIDIAPRKLCVGIGGRNQKIFSWLSEGEKFSGIVFLAFFFVIFQFQKK